MRFKAKLTKDKLSSFVNILTCIEKLSTSIIIHLSNDTIRMASPSPGSEDIQTFLELQKNEFFDEYRVESQSNDCILFEIGLGTFIQALNSGNSALYSVMKLAKRNNIPALCIATKTNEVDVAHDIPVKLMRADDIQYYLSPEIPPPSVQLELPRHKVLRTIIERLGRIDNFLTIDADMSGAMQFRISTDQVSIKTFYSHLIPRFDSLNEKESMNNRCTCRVDIRKLIKVFHFYSIPFELGIICLVDNCAVVFHVILSPRNLGTLTYYLPILHPAIDV